eukprot:4259074-Alexandrium_andersonii.AAC.1
MPRRSILRSAIRGAGMPALLAASSSSSTPRRRCRRLASRLRPSHMVACRCSGFRPRGPMSPGVSRRSLGLCTR